MQNTKIKKHLTLYSLAFAVAVVLLPFFSALLINYVSYDTQPSLDKTQKLDEKNSVRQSFIAKDASLKSIGMSIKNPNFTNKTDVFISVYNINNLKIVSGELSGVNIADGDFVKFVFPPISLKIGEKYYFDLSSPTTPEDTPYGVYISDNSLFENHMINKDEDEGAVSYVIFYEPDSQLGLATDIYKKMLSRFFSDKFFSIFYMTLVLGLMAGVIFAKESSS